MVVSLQTVHGRPANVRSVAVAFMVRNNGVSGINLTKPYLNDIHKPKSDRATPFPCHRLIFGSLRLAMCATPGQHRSRFGTRLAQKSR